MQAAKSLMQWFYWTKDESIAKIASLIPSSRGWRRVNIPGCSAVRKTFYSLADENVRYLYNN